MNDEKSMYQSWHPEPHLLSANGAGSLMFNLGIFDGALCFQITGALRETMVAPDAEVAFERGERGGGMLERADPYEKLLLLVERPVEPKPAEPAIFSSSETSEWSRCKRAFFSTNKSRLVQGVVGSV